MADLKNPTPFLAELTGQQVIVRLKWGQEYKGFLASSDQFMNLRLSDTQEFTEGKFAGRVGEVLIRCNNVLYIREVRNDDDEDEDDNDMRE